MASVRSIKSGARPPIRKRKSDRSKKPHVPIMSPEEREQLERDQAAWELKQQEKRPIVRRQMKDEEIEQMFRDIFAESEQKG